MKAIREHCRTINRMEKELARIARALAGEIDPWLGRCQGLADVTLAGLRKLQSAMEVERDHKTDPDKANAFDLPNYVVRKGAVKAARKGTLKAIKGGKS
jgi:hypothetical protein